MSVIDLRTQRRIIKIELEKTGYEKNIDVFVDKILEEIRKIYEQKDLSLKIQITIK